jgi:hypothetical protein
MITSSTRIPQKYQIFDEPVVVTSKDAERLKVHLTGWNKLNEMFLLGINQPDLRRLVVMELMGAARRTILTRLLGRLSKLERQTYMDRINKALCHAVSG